MSKKVIVLEDPGSCRRCFARDRENMGCYPAQRVFSDTVVTMILNGRDPIPPIWCPLRDLPEKMAGWSRYEDGWNAAIDAIGGGK
jgi:hypothetical protein